MGRGVGGAAAGSPWHRVPEKGTHTHSRNLEKVNSKQISYNQYDLITKALVNFESWARTISCVFCQIRFAEFEISPRLPQ